MSRRLLRALTSRPRGPLVVTVDPTRLRVITTRRLISDEAQRLSLRRDEEIAEVPPA